VHLAHLTVTRLRISLLFSYGSPLCLSLSHSLFVFFAPSRRPSPAEPRNVRFLMIVIEILLLLNWELMSGYAMAPVVRKLGDEPRCLTAVRDRLLAQHRFLQFSAVT